MEQKTLTLAEKWEIDAQAFRDGASAKTSSPQCKKCKYIITGNAMNCEKYKNKSKTNYVLFCEKECDYFESDNKSPLF